MEKLLTSMRDLSEIKEIMIETHRAMNRTLQKLHELIYPGDSDVISLKEIAAYMNISTDRVKFYIRKLGLPHKWDGKRYRTSRSEFLAWHKSRYSETENDINSKDHETKDEKFDVGIFRDIAEEYQSLLPTIAIFNEILNNCSENVKEKLGQADSRPMPKTDFMTVEQASKYLDVSRSGLYQTIHYGKIPFHKPNGKRVYFLKQDLDNWILAGKVKSEPELDKEATIIASKLSIKKYNK